MDKHSLKRPCIVSGPGRSENKKKIQKRLLRALLFLLILWAFLVFIRSDLFTIRAIEISGNTHTDEAEIRLALQINEGVNIWKVSPSQLQGNLENIPRIEHAEVHRQLPGTLAVNVLEKKPIVLVPYREYLLELCQDGQILGTTQNPHNYGLPLLTGGAPVEVNVGEYMLSEKQLEAIVAAVTGLEENGLAVSELNIADTDNLVIVMMDGLVVWLGDNEFFEKAQVLAQIAIQLQEKQADGFLDLRVKEAPAFSVLR